MPLIAGAQCAMRDACDLVKQITGCERVYAITFGEGAQHLHLDLLPRHLNEPASRPGRLLTCTGRWIVGIAPLPILLLWPRWFNAVVR